MGRNGINHLALERAKVSLDGHRIGINSGNICIGNVGNLAFVGVIEGIGKIHRFCLNS
jgi:hypothetical protein